MHLYVATKGIKMEVDEFIKQLQGKYLPFKYRERTDQPFQDSYVQLSVRPVQLWEIGYPKEHHDLVCNTILGQRKDYQGVMGNDGEKGCVHKWANNLVKWARRFLHLDPLEWNDGGQMPIRKLSVMTIGLGTKQDYMMETGVEGI